jgi:hypothetical protein
MQHPKVPVGRFLRLFGSHNWWWSWPHFNNMGLRLQCTLEVLLVLLGRFKLRQHINSHLSKHRVLTGSGLILRLHAKVAERRRTDAMENVIREGPGHIVVSGRPELGWAEYSHLYPIAPKLPLRDTTQEPVRYQRCSA